MQTLKKNLNASYADVVAKAEAKKLKVFPIMFGRVQVLLGIVKAAPRGQGKAAKARAAREANGTPATTAATAATARRGPGRRPRAAIDTSSLEGIVTVMRNAEQARVRYCAALEKIAGLLREARSRV